MGLLDEAIREHLELKRRRGADPTAVAREEHEALAPVFADDAGADNGHGEIDDAGQPDPQPLGGPTAGQETAELDMQALIDEQPPVAGASSPVGPIVDVAPSDYESPTEGAADWGLEGESREERTPEHEPADGQERLSFE
jgi:hypothetical protein